MVCIESQFSRRVAQYVGNGLYKEPWKGARSLVVGQLGRLYSTNEVVVACMQCPPRWDLQWQK